MDAKTVHTIFLALPDDEQQKFKALIGYSAKPKPTKPKPKHDHIPSVEDYKRSIITGKRP